MKLLLLATLLLAANSASYEDIIRQEWKLYKIQFQKSYDLTEDSYRMKIFANNKHNVATHNLRYLSGEESYEMAINEFSDMLPEEVDGINNGCSMELDGEKFVLPPNFKAPDSINWVEKGAVTPVFKRGKCKCCYAFVTAGALEGHQFIKTKKLVPLSMQNIIDCSRAYGNNGCNGGRALNAFNYIIENNGINDNETYPFEDKEGKCRFNPQKVAAKCTGVVQVNSGDEEMLKNAVALGPVAVTISANQESFQQYKGGVYSDPKCNSTILTRCLLAVGYGTDVPTKKDFWLLKNNLGTEWGEKGYIRMQRNANNMCLIASRAVYPKV